MATGGAMAPAPKPRKPRSKPKSAKSKSRGLGPLYDPLRPLSGKALRDAAMAVVRQAIVPQVQQINQQIGLTRAQTRAIANELAGLTKSTGAQLSTQEALERALAQRTGQEITQIGQQAASNVAQAAQGALDRMAQDAELRGPGLAGDAKEQLARELVAQQGRVGTIGATLAATARGIQEGSAAALRQMLGAQTVRGQELVGGARTAGQKAVSQLQQQRQQVLAQRSPLFQKALMELRGQEFEKFATRQNLGLKARDLMQDWAKFVRSDETKRRGQDLAYKARKEANRIRWAELEIKRQKLAIDRLRAEAYVRKTDADATSKAEKAGLAFSGLVSTIRTLLSKRRDLRDSDLRAAILNIQGSVPGPVINAAIALARRRRVNPRDRNFVVQRFGFRPELWAR